MTKGDKDKRLMLLPETTAKDIEKTGTIAADWFEEGIRVIVLKSQWHFCVYLGIAKDHPLSNLDYDDLPIDCHGGLTYAGNGVTGSPEGYFWYGYDYAHCDDYTHMPEISTIVGSRGKDWTLAEIVKDTWQALYDFKKLLKISERISRHPKPAPDVAGLVEAVRNHIRANDTKHIGRLTEEEMEPLRNALAAHKPEVDKSKSCPYCGTELVKRDTTALGGDESFDWCPDCERVIEDSERMDV